MISIIIFHLSRKLIVFTWNVLSVLDWIWWHWHPRAEPRLVISSPGSGISPIMKAFQSKSNHNYRWEKSTNYFDRGSLLASSWACLLFLSYHNYQIIREKISLGIPIHSKCQFRLMYQCNIPLTYFTFGTKLHLKIYFSNAIYMHITNLF